MINKGPFQVIPGDQKLYLINSELLLVAESLELSIWSQQGFQVHDSEQSLEIC